MVSLLVLIPDEELLAVKISPKSIQSLRLGEYSAGGGYNIGEDEGVVNWVGTSDNLLLFEDHGFTPGRIPELGPILVVGVPEIMVLPTLS